MIFNVPMMRKAIQHDTIPCEIAKAITLSDSQFHAFASNLMANQPLLQENLEGLGWTEEGVCKCLLVLNSTSGDGILINPEGYGYARYSAYIPRARYLYDLDRYPSMARNVRNMSELVDKCIKDAIDAQQNGSYEFTQDAMWARAGGTPVDMDLLSSMMADCPEVHSVDTWDGGFQVELAEDYVQTEDEKTYRQLTVEEVEIMCAKHYLWLHDAGGECADFSGALLDSVNLSGKDLCGANFSGSKLVNVNLFRTSICFADFHGARFYNCNAFECTAEEANLTGTTIVDCNMNAAMLTHADLSGAQFVNTKLNSAGLMNAIAVGTDFGDANLRYCDTRGMVVTADEADGESVQVLNQ